MNKDEELLSFAKEVSKNAYCKYSDFPVGACVLYSTGNYYTGCNIENSSYGLTLCAERNAISTAIASGETGFITKIAVYSPKRKKCFPCGACRQWLNEFQKDKEIVVILEDINNSYCTYTLNELLPYSFNLDVL